MDDQHVGMLRWESMRGMTPGPHDSGKTVIAGHTSQKNGEILDLGHAKVIDTYCYGGGWLTALDVQTEEVWQADREGNMRKYERLSLENHQRAKSSMRETIRRWGIRCLWLLPLILALYVTVMGVDFVWYRSHVPVRFQSANWEGRWVTHQYWGLSGRLLVRLPDPLPEDVDFKAEALVYYPCTAFGVPVNS